MTDQTKPTPDRPDIPKSYGIPTGSEGMLSWGHVTSRIQDARNFWIATTRPDGRPHAVPVWGVWVDETLYFGGGTDTRWARNLARNPRVVVHLDDSSEAVIIEGTVQRLDNPEDPLVMRIDDTYLEKYDMRHGVPFWRLTPTVAFAWTTYPDTVTRWKFD